MLRNLKVKEIEVDRKYKHASKAYISYLKHNFDCQVEVKLLLNINTIEKTTTDFTFWFKFDVKNIENI